MRGNGFLGRIKGAVMSNTMTYNGNAACIEHDDEGGIQDGVGFHADTAQDLRSAFHEAVEDYLETCAKIGKVAR